VGHADRVHPDVVVAGDQGDDARDLAPLDAGGHGIRQL
jgi:hypothetical protein